MADQKQYLLTSGSLTESELEEIKREAAQDGKPVSGLLSVTTDVCPGVQMSTLDVVSALSANSSVVMPLPDCCQTEDGLSLDSDSAMDPVLR